MAVANIVTENMLKGNSSIQEIKVDSIEVHLCDIIDDVTDIVKHHIDESEGDDGSRNIRT